MKICAREAAPDTAVRDQPMSFSSKAMIWLSDARAENETASAGKHSPTMIQAARSSCESCRPPH